MKILILGASSYVGARIYEELRKQHQIYGTYSTNKIFDELIQLDITNKEAVNEVIKRLEADMVIHTANNASGGWCEKNPEKAILLNETATGYIAEATKSTQGKLIYISSFAAETSTVYGQTKKQSEKIIKNSGAQYAILRPSLVVGLSPNTTNDRPFNRILKNLREKTTATYDTSWVFQPTYLGHITEIINQIINREDLYGKIIPITVAEAVNRYQLAKDILSPFGVPVEAQDLKDTTPFISQSLQELGDLNLPKISYKEMIEAIIKEISSLQMV